MRTYVSTRCINYLNNEVFARVHISLAPALSLPLTPTGRKYLYGGYFLGCLFFIPSVSLFSLQLLSIGMEAVEYESIFIWASQTKNGAHKNHWNIICDNLITVCEWSLQELLLLFTLSRSENFRNSFALSCSLSLSLFLPISLPPSFCPPESLSK